MDQLYVKHEDPESSLDLVEISRSASGPALNMARAIKRASPRSKVHLIGLVGDDEDGEIITTDAEKEGLKCNIIKREHRTTARYTATLEEGKIIKDQFWSGVIGALTFDEIYSRLPPSLDLIILDASVSGAHMEAMLMTGRLAKIPVLIDGVTENLTDRYHQKPFDILMPNISEFLEFLSLAGLDAKDIDWREKTSERSEILKKIKPLLRGPSGGKDKLLPKTIMVTLGDKEGVMFIEKSYGEQIQSTVFSHEYQGDRKQIVSEVGAGDNFKGTLIGKLLAGRTIREAVGWGFIAATDCCHSVDPAAKCTVERIDPFKMVKVRSYYD